jgi:hypothetical protein
MTHTGPMHESEGHFSQPEPTQSHCRHCSRETVKVQAWDSHCGSYTDYKYTCDHCGHSWWIEGPDA